MTQRSGPSVSASAAIHRPGRTIHEWQLTNIGHIPRKAEWIDRRFNVFAVGLVVAGSGSYRVNDGPVHAVGRGSVFTVFPGPVFRYGPHPGTTWREYYVGGLGPVVQRWIERGWFWQSGRVVQASELPSLLRLLREAMRLHARDGVGDEDRLALTVERFLCELHYARAGIVDRTDARPGVAAALNEVLNRLHEPIDWHRLARRHSMSYSSLRQQVRQLTGRPPHNYLIHLRCEAAKKLLAGTDSSIKQLCGRVGIPDPYTFSRTFKRTVGVSPEAYRTETQDWRRVE